MADSILRPDSASSVPGNLNAADTVTGETTTGGGHIATAGSDAAPGNPAATDPGITGVGPTGGGKAVPDADAMEQSSTIGDNESMDDAGGPGGSGSVGNQGSPAPTPGHTNADTAPNPLTGAPVGSDTQEGEAPTGGLNTGGTVGGTPTGDVGVGLGNEGR